MEFQIENKSKAQLLIAGTLWEIEQGAAGFSASTHKLIYTFKKGTAASVEFETEASGTSHLLTIEATDSASFAGGYYNCVIKAASLTDETEVIPLASIIINILPDPATSNDARSFAQKMVDKLETALLALADKTMSSISIEGRSYTYNNIQEMEGMRDYFATKAGIKNELSGRKRILTQFTND